MIGINLSLFFCWFVIFCRALTLVFEFFALFIFTGRAPSPLLMFVYAVGLVRSWWGSALLCDVLVLHTHPYANGQICSSVFLRRPATCKCRRHINRHGGALSGGVLRRSGVIDSVFGRWFLMLRIRMWMFEYELLSICSMWISILIAILIVT